MTSLSDTDLEDLYKGGDPPASAEGPHVYSVLRRNSRRIEEVEAEIKLQRERLAMLDSEREELLSMRPRLHNIVSGSRKLPLELLQEIFLAYLNIRLYTIDNGDKRNLESTLTTTSPPWTVSHVCRRWRLAALSLPRLWSYIGFSQTSKTPAGFRYLLETQLQRSASCSLYVTISDLRSPQEHRYPLLQCLLPCLSRCYALHLVRIPWKHVLQIATRKFPFLESLYIGSLTDGSSESFTFDAPRLSFLSTSSKDIFNADLPWSHVTTYISSIWDNADFLGRILPRMPSLVTCKVRAMDDNGVGVQMSPIVLAHLRHLEIGILDGSIPFLSAFTVPSLTSLDFSGPLHSVPPFLRQSKCSLTSLSMCSNDGQASEYASVLEETPMLEESTLDLGFTDTWDLEGYLTVISAPGCVPLLRRLCVKYNRWDSDSKVQDLMHLVKEIHIVRPTLAITVTQTPMYGFPQPSVSLFLPKVVV